MHGQAISDMIGRIRPGTTYSQSLYRVVTESARIAGELQDLRVAAAKDKNLSDIGRRTKVADESKRLLRDLLTAGKSQRAVVAQVAGRRTEFRHQPLEPGDAVGAARHAEIRAYLRKLPTGERMKMVAELSLDVDALEAVLDMPPAMSGFGGAARAQYDDLRKAYVQQHFGEQAKAVDDMEDDAAAAAAAIDLAMLDLREASDLPVHAFNKLADEIRAEIDKSR